LSGAGFKPERNIITKPNGGLSLFNRIGKRGCCVGGCIVSCIILLIVIISVVGWMTCSNNSGPTELTLSEALGEAVDNTELTWDTDGNAMWFPQTSTSFYGGDAAQSGAITNYQSSWLRTSVTGPVTLTFYWKLSSGDSIDYLKFYIDGVQQTQITGTVDWQPVSYKIDSGEHELEWEYTESGSVAGSGWLDKVELTTLGRGILNVFTNYEEVNIYVDNELIGTSEYFVNIPNINWGYWLQITKLTEGTHTLKLTKVGLKEWSKQVSISTKEATRVYAYMEEGATKDKSTTRNETIVADPDAYGLLKVVTDPDKVQVYIEGEFTGIAPGDFSGGTSGDVYWNYETAPPLLEGTYTLKLTKVGYKEWSKQVIIDAGRTTTVYAYVEPGVGTATTRDETITADSKSMYGTLYVDTGTAGTVGTVKLYVDNEFGGTFEKVLDEQPPYYRYESLTNGLREGTYTIRLVSNAYQEWTGQIEIRRGLATSLNVTLIRS